MAKSSLQSFSNETVETSPAEGRWMEEQREALLDKLGATIRTSGCIFGSSAEQQECSHMVYDLTVSFPVIPLTTSMFYLQKRTYLIKKLN